MTIKAKAVVLTAKNEYSVREIELDPPKDNEVRIRMAATGLCMSDLSVINGKLPMPMPIVLGHEGAGVVEEVGANVTNVQVGDHVITSFIPMCGTCHFCQHQEPWMVNTSPPSRPWATWPSRSSAPRCAWCQSRRNTA